MKLWYTGTLPSPATLPSPFTATPELIFPLTRRHMFNIQSLLRVLSTLPHFRLIIACYIEYKQVKHALLFTVDKL